MILPSIIKIIQTVVELRSRIENEEKYGSGDIIRLSFLYVTLQSDLFYNPTKYN